MMTFSSAQYSYLILNLYEQDLEELIKKEGETITKSRAQEMIRQMLEGLKASHARHADQHTCMFI